MSNFSIWHEKTIESTLDDKHTKHNTIVSKKNCKWNKKGKHNNVEVTKWVAFCRTNLKIKNNTQSKKGRRTFQNFLVPRLWMNFRKQHKFNKNLYKFQLGWCTSSNISEKWKAQPLLIERCSIQDKSNKSTANDQQFNHNWSPLNKL